MDETRKAYEDRSELLHHFTKLYPSVIDAVAVHAATRTGTQIKTYILYVETPAGQMSWHIAEPDMHWFRDVPRRKLGVTHWDGHTREERQMRMRRL